MLLTVVAWIASAAGLTAFAAVAFFRRRGRNEDELGSISPQWIAQHRSSTHDQSH